MRIGFFAHKKETAVQPEYPDYAEEKVEKKVPRKSVVQVYFPDRNYTLAYYNDLFDLDEGDKVYVDGKLAGQLGIVVEVNYNFKINLSRYKRVIALVDTTVHGEFFLTPKYVMTFTPHTLAPSQIVRWYKAPPTEEDAFVSGSDDSSFPLDHMEDMDIRPAIRGRGYDYYHGNHVKYLCLDGTKGYAIVQGTEAYEVEFQYVDGHISDLTCTCFCSYHCKHEYATLLMLRDILAEIERSYEDAFKKFGYVACLNKQTFVSVAIMEQNTGRLKV